jgi:hypothetical protein
VVREEYRAAGCSIEGVAPWALVARLRAGPVDAWRACQQSWREAEAMPGEAGMLADEIILIVARARAAGIDDATILAQLQDAVARAQRGSDMSCGPPPL